MKPLLFPMVFRIIAGHNLSVPEDWQEQLVDLLGSKPRRQSRWCELGLWGALRCLHNTNNNPLSGHVSIRVYSENGTIEATRKALEQAGEHLPLPVTFMQTLPGQLFNALGSALGWHGDGCSIAGANRQQTEIEMLRNIRQTSLLAWVDEVPEMVSLWVLLERTTAPDIPLVWTAVTSIFEISEATQWVQLDAAGKLFQAS